MKVDANFDVEVQVESGEIKYGKVKRGSLLCELFWRGKLCTSINFSIDGMMSQFLENLRYTENQARRHGHGYRMRYEGEISKSIRSDNGKVIGTLKLRPNQKFWKEHEDWLNEGKISVVVDDLLKIDATVRGGHFHNFSNRPADVLTPESVSFQRIVFPEIQNAFRNYCSQIDNYFTQSAAVPKSLSMSEKVVGEYGNEIELSVTFSLNSTLLKDRSATIRAFRRWFRNREGEVGQNPSPALAKPSPQAVEPKKVEVAAESYGERGQQGMTNYCCSSEEYDQEKIRQEWLANDRWNRKNAPSEDE